MSEESPSQLTIKREGKPKRCDICHQADLFDPETGVCERCTPVSARQIPVPAGTAAIDDPRIPRHFREAMRHSLEIGTFVRWVELIPRGVPKVVLVGILAIGAFLMSLFLFVVTGSLIVWLLGCFAFLISRWMIQNTKEDADCYVVTDGWVIGLSCREGEVRREFLFPLSAVVSVEGRPTSPGRGNLFFEVDWGMVMTRPSVEHHVHDGRILFFEIPDPVLVEQFFRRWLPEAQALSARPSR